MHFTQCKSQLTEEMMRRRGVPVYDIKLVDGGPEFEVCCKAPTFEQAIVYCFREAQTIVRHGRDLSEELCRAKNTLVHAQEFLHVKRRMKQNKWARDAEQRVLDAIDVVYAAQEAYQAWAKLYGDI
jgi:hypothetical protein